MSNKDTVPASAKAQAPETAETSNNTAQLPEKNPSQVVSIDPEAVAPETVPSTYEAQRPEKQTSQLPEISPSQSVSTPQALYHYLGASQSVLSAPCRPLSDQDRKLTIEASVDLYEGLQPQNALEAGLSSVFVGVTNATLDCLAQAALVSPNYVQHRDLNLRNGFNGARVLAELAKVLERCRGKQPGKVSVGSVKVEAGGQAIVGIVENTGPTAETQTLSSKSSRQAKKSKTTDGRDS